MIENDLRDILGKIIKVILMKYLKNIINDFFHLNIFLVKRLKSMERYKIYH